MNERWLRVIAVVWMVLVACIELAPAGGQAARLSAPASGAGSAEALRGRL